MRLYNGLFALILGAILVSACSVLPQQQPPEKTYDFGPLPTAEASSASRFPDNVMIGNVDATPWLQGRNIYYRFGYLDAVRLRSYTRSSWLTPPATLLRERVIDALARANDNRRQRSQDLLLNLYIQRFEQVFSAPHQAHVLIQVRASLSYQNQDEVLAQRVFQFTRKTKTADALGAVNAFSALSDQFIQSLAQWLNKVDTAS